MILVMNDSAPGHPGIPPRWTSSDKSGIGTAINAQSRVWFTASHGIINEVYYPSIDRANTRDFGFVVTGGTSFFSEEKRDAHHEVAMLGPGVPAYRLTNTCSEDRYRISKIVLTDTEHPVLLQAITFTSLKGPLYQYHLHALLAPHIDNSGAENSGWIGYYKGTQMMFAQRGDTTLALACSIPFIGVSCGYVGVSDGWQDLRAHGRMTWFYSKAERGNIALTAEIDLPACHGEFVLALGFGRNAPSAAHHARTSLLEDFDSLRDRYVREWEEYQAGCIELSPPTENRIDYYRVSTDVLKTCEAKGYPGGVVASLSIPWGSSKGDEDLGGYHLVWTRDQVEAAGGFLAAGQTECVRRILLYLMCTQEADGHWPQNMWLDGTPYWNGVQMDETALPILLADSVRRKDSLDGLEIWPMIQAAAGYLVCNGPVTPQDRWEEEGGYSPFTLAVEVAALLAAADFADHAEHKDVALYLRQTADIWNANIERWTYVTDTDLARRFEIDGYYVRIAPPEVADASSPTYGFVPIKNRPVDQAATEPTAVVSPDALALVRFGLRAANDPRIVNTVKIIDALLKTETATGPLWHRYNGDRYGEHEDGSAFDGTGVGRGWPLLAGERAHYELALGNVNEATRLLHVIENQSSPGGLIPEQVWDAGDLTDRELLNGRPSGSAMPLIWAHAEYIKLLRSLREGSVFDMPPQTIQRYVIDKVVPNIFIWRFSHKCRDMPAGQTLRIELQTKSSVHWSSDGWRNVTDTMTEDSRLGMQFADLATGSLPPGTTIAFTFFYTEDGRWDGRNFELTITDK
jgi:glucoamylase